MTLAADWIERFCVHGEGDYYGQPFQLMEWQRELVTDLVTVLLDRGPDALDRPLADDSRAAADDAGRLRVVVDGAVDGPSVALDRACGVSTGGQATAHSP